MLPRDIRDMLKNGVGYTTPQAFWDMPYEDQMKIIMHVARIAKSAATEATVIAGATDEQLATELSKRGYAEFAGRPLKAIGGTEPDERLRFADGAERKAMDALHRGDDKTALRHLQIAVALRELAR